MSTKTYFLKDENASTNVGQYLAKELTPHTFLGLSGEIGSGKTTLIRGFLRALGVTGPIKSPSFGLVESYETEKCVVHHFDLYRIQNETELYDIGWMDFVSPETILLVEWPEHAPLLLKQADLHLIFSHQDEGRLLLIKTQSGIGEKCLLHFPDTI